MTALSLTIPGKPQPKERARRRRNGRWVTPTATRNYEKQVCSVAGAEMLVQRHPGFGAAQVKVTIQVYWPDKRRRDVDNVAKSILDGMTKAGVWDDDAQVVELVVRKGLDRGRSRAEVTVEAASEEEPSRD